MNREPVWRRKFWTIGIVCPLLLAPLCFPESAHAQAAKKVRIAFPTRSVSFLAFYTAYHKRFDSGFRGHNTKFFLTASQVI
jgi:hypothetical protein